jgi:hypothetical protein
MENITRIERTGTHATAIVAPGGQRTIQGRLKELRRRKGKKTGRDRGGHHCDAAQVPEASPHYQRPSTTTIIEAVILTAAGTALWLFSGGGMTMSQSAAGVAITNRSGLPLPTTDDQGNPTPCPYCT